MAYRIIIDPGHGGSDPGATFNGRQEKDDALALAMAVGKLLSNAGFDVVYTRTSDVYNTPFEKATIGNNAGGDLFVSFHRNSSAIPEMYSGNQTLVYNDEGLKAQLARNINENMAALGFEDKGVVERPNLVVLKRSKMPAILLETGFINSETDNQIFDEKFNEIAQGIADGIIDTLSDNGITASEGTRYHVQVGAFRNAQLADNLASQLRNQGFQVKVISEDDLYKVVVGDFEKLDNAVVTEQKLRALGYNTFIRS
ncbi:MAG: N-acetylmuramoyl-L-alanine amidase [Eubacterium sp.]|nr:N-acetylmuramoyl-L-alanine amidase [Eubacterium sp.]